MKVGIIGCGNISETYFNCQKIFNNFEIIACADINTEFANESAEKFNIKAQSVDDIFLDIMPDFPTPEKITLPLHFNIEFIILLKSLFKFSNFIISSKQKLLF